MDSPVLRISLPLCCSKAFMGTKKSPVKTPTATMRQIVLVNVVEKCSAATKMPINSPNFNNLCACSIRINLEAKNAPKIMPDAPDTWM